MSTSSSAAGPSSPTALPFVRVLPKGPNAAPREVVWQSQRERMLEAIAAVVAEKGYGASTVAGVIARAGVSRKTFYEHFVNFEGCFMAAYEEGVSGLIDDVQAAVDAAPNWLAAMRAGLAAYLGALAGNPAFARTFLIEVLAVGPAALARRDTVHERFAELLASGYARARVDIPELPAVAPHVFRALVGATHELVVERLAHDGADALPALEPALLEIQLALYGGSGTLADLLER